MSRKREYREFLKSTFWKDLSAEKKRKHPKCRKCGARKNLQSHHIRYPKDWYETKLSDLEVLCRICHAKEHGIIIHTFPFMIYRDDVVFSACVHRIWNLNMRIYRGSYLRPRDEAFLDKALRLYPPTKTDACMKFHVEKCRETNEYMKAHSE